MSWSSYTSARRRFVAAVGERSTTCVWLVGVYAVVQMAAYPLWAQPRRVKPRVEESVRTAAVELEAWGTITGRVVDSTGRFSAGVKVWVSVAAGAQSPSTKGRSGEVITTTADGGFSLRVPPRAAALLVARTRTESARMELVPFEPGATKSGIVLRLDPGPVMRASVRDEAGAPVQAAEISVQLVDPLGRQDGEPSESRCRTLQDGQCAVSMPEAGRYRVVVGRAGFRARTLDNVSLPLKASVGILQIVLSTTATITGQVVDQSGGAVEGASIVAKERSGNAYQTLSDARGRFELADVYGGQSVVLSATSPGYASARSVIVVGRQTPRLVLRATSVVRGRVVSARDQSPVKSFSLEFSRRPNAIFRQSTPGGRHFESEDGTFEWQDVPPGAWTVTVRAAGYQPAEIAGIQLNPKEVTEGIVFNVAPGLSLSGTVVDAASGVFVAGASITFRDVNSSDRREHETLGFIPVATSDAEGRFILDSVAQGRVALTVRAQGYAETRRELDLSANSTVEIELGRGGVIDGVVVAATGVPLEQLVQVELIDASTETGSAYHTDATGRFEFRDLAPGSYRVKAEARDGRSAMADVILANAQHVSDLALVLKDGAVIRGLVTGLGSTERQGLQVSAVSAAHLEATAVPVDADGQYEIKGIKPDIVELTVRTSLARELSKRVEVTEVGEYRADFAFPPLKSRIAGRVTRDDKPVAFAALEAIPNLEGGVRAEGETFQDGRYVIEGLEDGEYTVRVGIVAGVMVGSIYRVSVVGDTVLDIELPLLGVSGRVVESESGVPLPSATVVLRAAATSEPPFPVSTVYTDASGAYTIPGLKDGEYDLTAYKRGFRARSEYRRITPGSLDVIVEMTAADGDRVRIRDAVSGAPLRLARVTSVAASGATTMVIPLDTQGYGEVPRVGSGTYDLLIAWDGYAPHRVSGVTPSDSRLDVFLAAGAQLRIEVRRDFTGYRALLTNPDRTTTRLALSHDVTLTLEPGYYVLTLISPAGVTKNFDAHVRAGSLAAILLH